MRVSDWRIRTFGPLYRTLPEVPRAHAIMFGAFVAIRQVGQLVTLAADTGVMARIVARTRPDRFMSATRVDCALTIAKLELHSIIPRYGPIPHRRYFGNG